MKTAIRIENLTLSYGYKKVLKGISFEVKPGEIVGYIGPNGAGKSTTIKTILGIAKPDSGSIYINEVKIATNDYFYKSKIGYVPESAALYECLTGSEYLSFVGQMQAVDPIVLDKRIDKMCAVFDLKDDLDSRISSYSKGMKQKLLIISSMLHDPEILIFDEPINGMDANSVKVFKEIMASLITSGKTILYSSHLMDIVERVSNRIIIINNGEILADDTLENLKQSQHQGSLEMVFNQITGFDSYSESVTDFMDALKNGKPL